MNNYDELIRELSGLCGILPDYWDIFGKNHVTSVDTAKAILKAMKLKVDSADDVACEINARRARQWKNFLEPVHVLSVNAQPFSIPVYIPVEESGESKLMVSWSIEDESGKKDRFEISGDDIHISGQQWIDGERYVHVHLLGSKRRDIGYYMLHVVCRHSDKIFPGGTDIFQKRSKIIITPDTCYIPAELENGRAWGLAVNLYSIRSKRNWGIGDFNDLEKIVRWVAGLKGQFVGINPLHGIPNTKPFGVSPYSPISRLYKNYIYLDVQSIPEVKESKGVSKALMTERFKKKLEKLRNERFIDYERAALLKEKILRKAFDIFYKKHFTKETGRGRAFKKFIADEGLCLESFALFMSLGEYMREKKKAFRWQEWPQEYRHVAAKAVRKFREKNEKALLFYQYVQWLIDRRLKVIAGKTKKFEMTVGLYNDLAVGSVSGGSDAWSFQDLIAEGAEVGAPPDDFSPDGQKWGFPPVIPERLREAGYDLFIQTIRKNMKYGGALRIDHALGLFRLFWIPEGMTPKDGAYVSCPSEDLLRIIALESIRNRTMVIAEDLGTIGENVREGLMSFRMLSYRLFYFERNYPDPSFLPPDKYPLTALCAVTTHDLPTIYGYWKGRDIDAGRRIGKYPDDAVWNKTIEERERDKRLLIAALKSRDVISVAYPSDPAATPDMTPELCRAIYNYLALAPCKVLSVSLDDIIGTLDQQNMPGTVDSYPNWRQKTPLNLEEIVKDRRLIELSRLLNRYFL